MPVTITEAKGFRWGQIAPEGIPHPQRKPQLWRQNGRDIGKTRRRHSYDGVGTVVDAKRFADNVRVRSAGGPLGVTKNDGGNLAVRLLLLETEGTPTVHRDAE